MKRSPILSILLSLMMGSSMVHAMESDEGKEAKIVAPTTESSQGDIAQLRRQLSSALEAQDQEELIRLFIEQLRDRDIANSFIGWTIFDAIESKHPEQQALLTNFIHAAEKYENGKAIIGHMLDDFRPDGITLLVAAVASGSPAVVSQVYDLARSYYDDEGLVNFINDGFEFFGRGTAIFSALRERMKEIVIFLLSLPRLNLTLSPAYTDSRETNETNTVRDIAPAFFDECAKVANEIIRANNRKKREEIAQTILATGKLPISSLEFLISDYVVVDQPLIPVPEEKEPIAEEGKEPVGEEETLEDLEGDLEHKVATVEAFDTTTGRINDMLRTRPGTTEEVSRLNYLTNLVARVVSRYINNGYIDLVNHILNIYGTGFEPKQLKTIRYAARTKQISKPENEVWKTIVSRIDTLLSPTGVGSSGDGASSSFGGGLGEE